MSRYKGLGEIVPSSFGRPVDPEHRVIVQITIEDAMAADEAFTILMGDKVEPRKSSLKGTPSTRIWMSDGAARRTMPYSARLQGSTAHKCLER